MVLMFVVVSLFAFVENPADDYERL
uniref:Uncharacterized protein n=1 Tax=Rhizophora mucronata TaxID=61149 RepID=A0A2P2IMM5_RHIMU